MESLGLAVGVVGLAGLFSSCLEVIDRVHSYRSFGSDSGVLEIRFQATKVRLAEWGQKVGFRDQILIKDHHPALDKHNVYAAVKDVLLNIHAVCGVSKTPSQPVTESRRKKLIWALGDKAKRTEQISLLEDLIQQLHNLVPPDGTDILVRRDIYTWLGCSCPIERYHDALQKRVDGTCDWILQRWQFKDWVSPKLASRAKLLWIHGPAGFGKTILCARIVEHVSSAMKAPSAYCFFSAELKNRDDPFQALRSWIIQIISKHDVAFECARLAWNKDSNLVSTRTTCLEIFKELIRTVPGCTFIADGLDECIYPENSNSSAAKFIRIITSIVAEANTRILIVSRDEPEIRQAIQGAPDGFSEYKIVLDDVRSDTAICAKEIVGRKLSNKNAHFRSTLSTAMTDRCEGQFLWLKLQEGSLRSGLSLKKLHLTVRQTPAGLDEVYRRSWDRITHSPECERICSLLRWVAFAVRPLSITEVTEAVLIDDARDDLFTDDLPDEVDDDYVQSEIIGLCGPLIEVKSLAGDSSAGQKTLHLTHFSVREFLARNLPMRDLISVHESLRSAYHNTLLAKACLHYLKTERVWREVLNHPSGLGTSFCNYAAGAWHQHIKFGLSDNHELSSLVVSFLNHRSPVWQHWSRWSDQQDPLVQENQSSAGLGNPLHYAVKLELPNAVRALIHSRTWDVNEENDLGFSALQLACIKGNEEVLEILLDAGADINAPSSRSKEWTPLLVTAVNGHLRVAKLLLDRGASVTAVSSDGETALHLTAIYEQAEMAKLLIAEGADIEAATLDGATPLFLSSANEQLGVAKLLIGKGANVMVKTKDKHTPLHVAAFYGFSDLVEILLQNKADTNATTSLGWTPIHLACEGGHIKVAELLIQHGVNMEAVTSPERNTPLLQASWRGYIDIVSLLIEHGASVRATNNNGWTAVHLASDKGHPEVVKLLTSVGAGPMVTALTGDMTPLHSAS